jgi:hypothetical protein
MNAAMCPDQMQRAEKAPHKAGADGNGLKGNYLCRKQQCAQSGLWSHPA